MQFIKINISFSVLLLMAFFVLSFSSCKSTTSSDDTKWQLVWQDEFDGTAGVLPDSTKWGYGIGTGWGNAQLEYDTNRPQNVSLDGNGHLVITAVKESYQGQSYTSARINTKNKYTFTYGKIEARIKAPWGQGIWPAFWMLGANDDTETWPACGEIDIMEMQGQIPSRNHGSVHGPGYSGTSSITKPYNLINDRFDNDFHTFAVEWKEDSIRFFVDNILYETVTTGDVTGTWVYNHPFYIILNLAVGGSWVGSPNAATVFPQTMTIDYVRVYKAI